MAERNSETSPQLEYGETKPPRGDVKEQRGGPQTDQITGQSEKGAHNQAMKGRNPHGNEPDRTD